MAENNAILRDPECDVLQLNKDSGFEYRKRRQDQWTENYDLGRGIVQTNRLTQRQSVHIPLMKTVMRTMMKDIDDLPGIYFENLDNDKQAEIFKNEYWKKTLDDNDMEIKDIVDKKQEFYFGRTFDQMQIVDGVIKITIVDPEDILIDRFCDPADIDSARFFVHTHIFVPLTVLKDNKDYDQEKIKDLEMWFASEQGIVKAVQNDEMRIKKNQKMVDLGLEDVDDPVLGETWVELSMHFMYDKRERSDTEELFLKVEAENMKILLDKPLEEILGVTQDHYWQNHIPYNTWADDVENQDFWCDGIADIVRPSNKVLNAWYSQLVENRTLKNLNMNFYDATADEAFQPQTWEPKTWGWYGLPGKPSDVMQQIPIADLSDSLDEMKFVIEFSEKATGATPTQQGVQTDRQITLGEVQLALGEAKERIKTISKFYTKVWKDRAEKFVKLIEGSPDKLNAVTIFKKGRNTDNIYSREVQPSDWMTPSGYRCRVWSMEEKKMNDSIELEKMNAMKVNMPDNPKVDEIFKRKLTEFAGVSPEESNEILAWEQQKRMMMQVMMAQGLLPMQPGANPATPAGQVAQQQPEAKQA